MTTFEKIVKYVATGFAALLAVGIVVGILQGILLIIGIISGNSGKTIDSNQVFEMNKGISNIQIESSVGDIQFYETTGNEIRIDAKSVSENYSCELDDKGTIIIRNKNTKSFVFSWFRRNSTIKIYIPKELELKSVNLDLGVGDVKIQELAAKELIIDSGIGEIQLKDSKIMNLEADFGIGDFKTEDCQMGNIQVENGIGDIRLNLIGDINDYEIEVDKGLGDSKINDENIKYYKEGEPIYEISCDSGIGDIKINIKN